MGLHRFKIFFLTATLFCAACVKKDVTAPAYEPVEFEWPEDDELDDLPEFDTADED